MKLIRELDEEEKRPTKLLRKKRRKLKVLRDISLMGRISAVLAGVEITFGSIMGHTPHGLRLLPCHR